MRRPLLILLLLPLLLGQQYNVPFNPPVVAAAAGNSCFFNAGANAYATVIDHASLDFPAVTDWSICQWYYFDATQTVSYSYSLSSGAWGAANTLNLAFPHDGEADEMKMNMRWVANNPEAVSATPKSEWRFICWVFNDTADDLTMHDCNTAGTCVMRVDAISCAWCDDGLSPAAFTIGRQPGSPNKTWDGNIAYTLIIHQALTDAEVANAATTRSTLEAWSADGDVVMFLNADLSADLCTTCCGGSGCTPTRLSGATASADGPYE